MTGNEYFLDTNIIIYYLQGKEGVYDFVNGTYVYISFVTELELLSDPSLSNEEERKLRQLLKTFRIFEINSFIKEQVIELRKKYKLKLPDAIIAATAAFPGLDLVTADSAYKKLPIVIFYQNNP